jgi:hypothetical protein
VTNWRIVRILLAVSTSQSAARFGPVTANYPHTHRLAATLDRAHGCLRTIRTIRRIHIPRLFGGLCVFCGAFSFQSARRDRSREVDRAVTRLDELLVGQKKRA